MTGYLLVNFGGPRTLEEIPSFLTALLTDKDVIRSRIPFLFNYIAKRRAPKVAKDYALIGGKSPIFEETEKLKDLLQKNLNAPVFTFHRYLKSTHKNTLEEITKFQGDKLMVFPLFPQFSYTTTGSTARFFYKNLPKNLVNKMRWVKSYATHPAFIHLWQVKLRNFLQEHRLEEKEVFFLFSAHGLPQSYVEEGDLYAEECRASSQKVMKAFPQVAFLTSFQSEFGKALWLKPSTKEVCSNPRNYVQNRKKICVIPIAFTSDHIETLFEIEKIYLPLLQKDHLQAYRVPALYGTDGWVDTITKILKEDTYEHTKMLIRWS